MVPLNFELRLQHLEDNIRQDQDLLKDYQDALRYEDDPLRKAKYSRKTEELRQSVICHQKEYDELRIQITGEPTVQMQNIDIQLQQINSRLNRLSTGQKAIYENINHSRQELLAHYNAIEQKIIAAITERLDQAQINRISTVLDAIEADQVTEAEMRQIVEGAQQILNTLQQRRTALPPSQQELAKVINAPGMDFNHRLKVALPIIPFLLDYEGELELGTGINLKAAWQVLLVRLRGE